MQYATVRHAAPAPLYGPPTRTRRNTMEPNGRQNQNMIQLVKESQRQQYAHEYIDDRSSFVRAQKAEEERIQQDMERAMRAQRRERARKFARASKAAEQRVQSTPVDDWRHGGNVRRPSIVACAPQPTVGMTERFERGRLESFQFPYVQTKTRTHARPPVPLKFQAAERRAPPVPSPNKRLAPLPRFNPFVRARSESLSSLMDDEQPGNDPAKRKRNASVSALFARINEAARTMQRQG
ncbi:hypothetical protein C8R47DRAFT_1210590 [Mycena vitilis]|nr:hypothetical protein C8R47DRAFT_1210590 [Mycena vitilis]